MFPKEKDGTNPKNMLMLSKFKPNKSNRNIDHKQKL
jgi:hypothetical protein